MTKDENAKGREKQKNNYLNFQNLEGTSKLNLFRTSSGERKRLLLGVNRVIERKRERESYTVEGGNNRKKKGGRGQLREVFWYVEPHRHQPIEGREEK